MSGKLGITSVGPSLNSTAVQDAIYEFRVFNMAVLSLTICILTVTAAICCVSYYSHTRSKCHRRTRAYENTMEQDSGTDLVSKKVTRKRWSLWTPLSLLCRQDETRDNSHIYYIYSNPLPVGHKDDDPSSPKIQAIHTPLNLQDYANDPQRNIVLDPPTFYMQL